MRSAPLFAVIAAATWVALCEALSAKHSPCKRNRPPRPVSPAMQNDPITPPGRGIYPESAREQLAPVVSALVELFQEKRPEFRPTTVSFSWHAVAEFNANPILSPRTGGSAGGCMGMDPQLGLPANKGLDEVVEALEPIHQRFPFVSRADLHLLAGNTAIEFMGGPSIRFRPGRRDFAAPQETDLKCIDDNDRMPMKHVNNDTYPHRDTLSVFFTKWSELGFSLDTDPDALYKIVALMGGHNVGFMHTNITGNEGQWTENPMVFGTEYFYNLDVERWVPSKAERVPSTGNLQYRNGELVMLPVDIVMLRDVRMRAIVRKFAQDKDLFFQHYVPAWQRLQENGVAF